jgi:deoxyribodipyrimidine photo-lyase
MRETQSKPPLIYWFRIDLRLTDVPALVLATELAKRNSQPLLPVFCHAPPEFTRWDFERVGVHRQHILRATLDDLTTRLKGKGSDLQELHGPIVATLLALCHALGATHIVCEEIAAPQEHAELAALRAAGLQVDAVWQSSLLDPAQLPFAVCDLPDVFTSFRQKVEKVKLTPPMPLPEPDTLPMLPFLTNTAMRLFFEQNKPLAQVNKALDAINFDKPEARSSYPYHTPEFAAGESAALAHLHRYLAAKLPHSYKATRNQLSGAEFSSKFSPWLASGALPARTIYAELKTFEAEQGANEGSYWLWFELLWRDYFRLLHFKYGAQLYHAQGLHAAQTATSPQSASSPTANTQTLQRWCQGDTGTPLVDAAMRELRLSGYLSNRLRQVVASFWLHELKGDWRAGAAWFESQLVDYDVYSNTGNWLYIAGLGTDPRGGRHFDVAKQTRDHDPDGRYQRLWLTNP